jgi:hypothetical protein
MRILFSESETEELGTQASCSQVKIVSDYVPPNENVMGEGKRVSPAWLCFDREKAYQKNGNDYVKCNQPKCGAEFKLNLTTSINLSRHVTQIHSNLLPQKKGNIKGPKQKTLSLSMKAKLIPPFSEKTFQQYLTDMIVVQDLPFLFLESTEFRDFVSLLRPGTRVLKADSLKNNIMDRFKKMKSQMMTFWSSIDSRVSFTTDIWTSPNDLSFMAITAHWISSEFVLQSMLLDFVELEGSHTGVNIEKTFSHSLKEYNLFEKKFAITLDNAYNNDNFISALMERDPSFDREHHIRCFGHILNLSAQDALGLVEIELSGIRDYIKAIIHRPKRLDQLEEDFLEAGGKNFVKPILDVKTRWNSTADMVHRALRLKVGLNCTMESMFDETARKRRKGKGVSILDSEEESFVQITDQHWKNFTDILDLLEPLKEATNIMSGDTYPSLNMVVPAYVAIMNHLELLSSSNDVGSIYTESNFKVDASKAALMKLDKYYNISSELCTIATVLDPRLKLDFYRADKNPSADDPEEIQDYIKSFFLKDYAPSDGANSRNPSPAKSNLLHGFYKKARTSDKRSVKFRKVKVFIAN